MSERARLSALAHGDALIAPQPGWFRCLVADQQAIAPDDIIGELDVLGRTMLLVAPNIRGVAKLHSPGSADAREAPGEPPNSILAVQDERRPVGYGDVLLRVVAATTASAHPTAVAGVTAPEQPTAQNAHVFRAPTAGRFYARPAPDKPLFVSVGAELTSGAVIGLLEVMKTFTRVTYTGGPARVRAALVADGADVKAGDPLLELEVA